MWGRKKKAKKEKETEEPDLPSWLKEDDNNKGDGGATTGETTPLVKNKSLDEKKGAVDEDYGTAGDDGDDDGDAADEEMGGEGTEDVAPSSAAARDEPDHTSWSELPTGDGDDGDDDAVQDKEDADAAATKKQATNKGEKKKKKKKGAAAQKKKKKADGRPKRPCCLLIFNFIRLLAIISCLLMLILQVVPLIVVKVHSLQWVVRIYVTIFCVIFMTLEADLNVPFIRSSPALHNWVFRGFLYSFIGVIGMEQNIALQAQGIGKHMSVLGPDYGTLFESLFVTISAWFMVGIGALYAFLGLLCMQALQEKMRRSYRERMDDYLHEQQMRREEGLYTDDD